MKLRALFVISLLTVLVVMAAPAIYGVVRIHDVRGIALDLREQAAQSAFHLGELRAAIERLDRHLRTYVSIGDEDVESLADATLERIALHLDRVATGGYDDAVVASGFPIERLRSMVGDLVGLVEAGRMEEATERFRVGARPLLREAESATATLARAIDQQTAGRVVEADRLTAAAVAATRTALFVAIVLAAVLAFVAARVLTRPLERLTGSMTRVADGHFQAPEDLPYHRRDEVGELLRAFRAMAMRLADLDRMKAEFVGIASHDLKTPISVIAGYTELLQDELAEDLDDRHRDVLVALARQAGTLGRRVNQLLEISRMEASGLRLGLEEINLRHFTAAVEKAHAAAAARYGIALSSAVEDGAPSFLIADPDCLRTEVLGNLLDSALRFTPRGGTVHLHVRGDSGRVTFEVRDSGRPIPPEDLPHVFDRYYRGRGLPGRVGSGLGLPIARAGALAHGGDITVESGPWRTVFRLNLPIHPTVERTLSPVPL